MYLLVIGGELLIIFSLLQYLSTIFHNYMDSGSKTGLWTAIPYASMWACSIVFSLISDFLIRRKIFSTATVRKVRMLLKITK